MAEGPRSPHPSQARDEPRNGAEAGGGSWLGSRFVVTVGPVAHGGHCVARHEGRVVFVRHTLPGERVVVEVTEDRHKGFCRADAVEVLEAAPDRVERPCPYSGPGRGGGGCGGRRRTGSSGPARTAAPAGAAAATGSTSAMPASWRSRPPSSVSSCPG